MCGGRKVAFHADLFSTLLTHDSEPVVEGDHDDPAVGRDDPAVPQVARAPVEGLAVDVDHHGEQIRVRIWKKGENDSFNADNNLGEVKRSLRRRNRTLILR